jgi:hypothetical protein
VRRPGLRAATLAALVVGVALMVLLEGALARTLGVAALFAFIGCGVFLIANPADLGADEREPGELSRRSSS